MTEILREVETPSDAELISRVRGGEVAAYGELFARHRLAATRLARQLLRGPDSDDLVADAFAKVLSVLQGGGGPDVAFRAYLLTAVRRLHIDRVRAGQRLQTTDDMTKFDPGVPFQDTAVAGFESGAAARAFASLPERWQLVLWHLEVEGQKPADIAPLLGMSANSVSALAYRAREGLRQAFLTMHLSDISDTDCRWVNEHLGAFVRKGLAKRDVSRVQGHLTECRRCTAMYLELDDVNSNLAAIIGPLLLGSAAVGYAASLAGGGGAAAGALGMLSRAKDVVREVVIANTGAAAAGGAAAAVAATAVVAVAVTQHASPRREVVADAPSSVRTAAPALPGGSAGNPLSGTPTSAAPTSPVATLSAAPSATPSATASAPPTDASTSLTALDPTATDQPTDLVTAEPSDAATDAVTGNTADTVPGIVGSPEVSADGEVTVVVAGVGSDDTVDLRVTSRQTTFQDSATGADCTLESAHHLSCAPPATGEGNGDGSGDGTGDGTGDGNGGADARQIVNRLQVDDAGDDTARLTITTQLTFPDYMVADDIELQVSVSGGDQATSGEVAFRPTRTPTYDFAAPVLDGPLVHTLAPGATTDGYTATTTVALPPRVTGLVYHLAGAATFRSASSGCELSDQGSSMTCPDVGDGDQVGLDLTADGLSDATVASLSLSPVDNITDPAPANDTEIVLSPGADLGLALRVFSADPDHSGLVVLTGTLAGVRPGLSTVTYTVGAGATFPADPAVNPGCVGDGATLSCPVPAGGGPVALTVLADDSLATTPLTVTVAPQAPFQSVALGGNHDAAVTLPGRAQHDFSLTSLTEVAHTLQGGTDHYDLRGVLGALPAGVGTVDLTLAGGDSFDPTQTDDRCQVTAPGGGGAVRCTGLDPAGGPITLSLVSPAGAAHPTTVTVLPTAPFEDPDGSNDTRGVSLRPGAHLALSPASVGDLHQDPSGNYVVTTTVTGIRPGLGTLTFTPSAGTEVTGSPTPGCAPDGGTLVCTGLAEGTSVTAVVTSGTPRAHTDLTLTASPGGEFVGLGGDGTVGASLVPAADFSVSGATLRGQSLVDGADDHAITLQVGALPGPVDTVSFRLEDGGGFAAGQEPGCQRTGTTTVACSGLAAGGAVTLHVRSTSLTTHPATVRLLVPPGYDDLDPSDDTATVTGLRPGADLHLAALDPLSESPADVGDLHRVAAGLTGVPDGLGSVVFTLDGAARFTAVDVAGCTVSDTTVTCAGRPNGPVTFTVAANDLSASTPVGITASPGAPFTELAPEDNAESLVLLPLPR